MRVINVITIRNGVVDNVQSYGIYNEKIVDSIVQVAEKFYVDQIKEWSPEVTEDDIETSLDNGYFEDQESDSSTSVCISWSNVDTYNRSLEVGCGDTITTIGELRAVLAECDDDDEIILAPCDEDGDETDHYPFYVDIYDGLRDDNTGVEFREVRLCQKNYEEKKYDAILTPVAPDTALEDRQYPMKVIRPDIISNVEGVPVGDKYYYGSAPLRSRWKHEDEDNEEFQVYFEGQWLEAQSIDWDDYIKPKNR
jgi:hypothetical protein